MGLIVKAQPAAVSQSLTDPLYDRRFRFIASTNDVDRYGDVIVQDWDLAEYRANPVVLWAHRSGEPIIGKVTDFEISADRRRSIASVQMVPQGTSVIADQLVAQMMAGFPSAVSVGFLPGKTIDRVEERSGRVPGYVYSENKLVELSLVSVPANPHAVQLARSLGVPPDILCQIFSESVPAAPGLSARDRFLLQADLDLMRLRYG